MYITKAEALEQLSKLRAGGVMSDPYEIKQCETIAYLYNKQAKLLEELQDYKNFDCA